MKVIYRTESSGLTGITTTSSDNRVIGCFPAKVSFLTRAMAYSGSEMVYPEATLPYGSVRFSFWMSYPFNFKYVQFEYRKNVYLPIWPGIEIGDKFVYTCSLQEPESRGEV